MHNRTVKKKGKEKKEKKNDEKMKMERKNDSRVKTRKGSLEQKRENFWSLIGEANRRMKGQWPDSIRNLYEVLYPFQNQKFELLVPESLPPNSRVYHGGSWRLSNCHIQELKIMNLFKMFDFQRIHFFKKKKRKKKGTFEKCHLLCSTKLWK